MAPAPIQINGDTAKVAVTLYTDEDHLNKLNGPVTSTSHFYGAFSAEFLTGEAPKPGDNVAVYEFPDTIVVDNNAGGDLMEGSGTAAAKAGTWKIEDNKVIFTFDEGWLKSNPADIYVAANFSWWRTIPRSARGSARFLPATATSPRRSTTSGTWRR